MCCHYPQHIAIFFEFVVHTESDVRTESCYIANQAISIHVLHAENDGSTLLWNFAVNQISIHVLHAENDVYVNDLYVLIARNFNPRSPCGERQQSLTKYCLLYFIILCILPKNNTFPFMLL